MTFNALGIKIKGTEQTLAAKLGIELPEADKPTKLEIENVYTDNLSEIVVKLSNASLVKNDKEQLTNPANYRLNDTKVKVQHVDVIEDEIRLTLVPYGKVQEQGSFETLIKGKEYKLTIRNIEGISVTDKKFTAEDNSIPTVEKVEFIGTHGIKVTTSEPVNKPEERNFKVNDKRTSMIIEQYGRELILTPYHKEAFDKDANKLTISELVDFSGYKSASVDKELVLSTDEATPKVEKAFRNGSELTLVFDRDVNHKSIEKYESRRELGNVSFRERTTSHYANDAKKVDTNVVKYTFEREIPRDAVVIVEGVKNHFDKAMEKQEITTIMEIYNYAPVVISKLSQNIVSEGNQNKGEITNATKKLEVSFDKDIEELSRLVKATKGMNAADTKAYLNNTANFKPSNFFKVYEIDVTKRGEDRAKNVEIIVEEVKTDSIKISFKEIHVNNKDRDYDYVLEVRDFTDLNRNRMEREYVDFQIVPQGSDFDVKGNIEVVRGEERNTTEVRIEFNDSVSKVDAENPKNYFFGEKGKDLLVKRAIVERDGKRVSLVIVDKTVQEVQEYKVLELSPAITNIYGDKLTTNRFFDLRTGKGLGMGIANPGDVKTEIDGVTIKQLGSDHIAAKDEVKASTDFDFSSYTFNAVDEFSVIVKVGATSTKGTFALVESTTTTGKADLDKLAEEINANVDLKLVAKVDGEKIELEAKEAVEGMEIIKSGSLAVTAGTPVPGEAAIKEVKQSNQIVELNFGVIDSDVKKDDKVTFTGHANVEGKVTEIKGNVVVVEIEIDTANNKEGLAVGDTITEAVFARNSGSTNVTIKTNPATGVVVK